MSSAMTIDKQVLKEKQKIARYESTLALEKIKKRRADTRRKIELGGLVIKSGFESYNKAIILGALSHAWQLIESDTKYLSIFEAVGNKLFLENF